MVEIRRFPRILVLVLTLLSDVAGLSSAHSATKIKPGDKDGLPFRPVLQIAYPQNRTVPLGIGWNVANGLPTASTCVIFSPYHESYEDAGSNVSEVTTAFTIEQKLANSSSGSFGYEKTLNLSSETSIEYNSHVNRNATQILAEAWVLKGAISVAPLSTPNAYLRDDVKLGPIKGGDLLLSNEAIALLKARRLLDFHDRCGDMFVSVINRGATITALLQLFTMTSEEDALVKAHVGGGVSIFGIGGKGDSSDSDFFKTLKAEKRIYVNAIQLGGNGQALITDVSSLETQIQDLPKVASKEPRPFSMVLQSYDTLPNWPPHLSLPKPGSEEKLNRTYLELYDLYSELTKAVREENFEKFEPTIDSDTQVLDSGSQNVTYTINLGDRQKAEKQFVLAYDLDVESVGKIKDFMLLELRNLRDVLLKCRQDISRIHNTKSCLNEAQRLLNRHGQNNYFYLTQMPPSTHSVNAYFQPMQDALMAEVLKNGDASKYDPVQARKDFYDAYLESRVFDWYVKPHAILCEISLDDCLTEKQIDEFRTLVKKEMDGSVSLIDALEVTLGVLNSKTAIDSEKWKPIDREKLLSGSYVSKGQPAKKGPAKKGMGCANILPQLQLYAGWTISGWDNPNADNKLSELKVRQKQLSSLCAGADK